MATWVCICMLQAPLRMRYIDRNHVTNMTRPLVPCTPRNLQSRSNIAISPSPQSCSNIVWRASPFTREEGSGVMPIRELFPRSQECGPIRSLHVTFDLMGLSPACVLTNQMLDLHIHKLVGAIPSVHTGQSGARS